jgi:hypothetical protein
MALRLLRSTAKAARGGQRRRSSGSPRATGLTLGSVQGGGRRSGLMQRRAWRRRWLKTAGALGGFEPKRRMGEGENGGPARRVEEEEGGLAAGGGGRCQAGTRRGGPDEKNRGGGETADRWVRPKRKPKFKNIQLD